MLKLLAGIGVGMVYTHIYPGGDTFALFEAGNKIREVAFSSLGNFADIFIYNRFDALPEFGYSWIPSAFMVKVLAVLSLLTGSSYWMTALWLSLIGFMGFRALAIRLYAFSDNKWAATIPVFFIPSFVFWTSGVIKETMAISALAWAVALFLELFTERHLSLIKIIGFILSFIVLAILKYYFAGVLLVAVLTTFMVPQVLPEKASLAVVSMYTTATFLVILIAISLLHPNLWPSRILAVIYANYSRYHEISGPENIITYNELQPNLLSFALNAPKALAAGLFAPLWWHSFSVLKLVSVIENWLVLGGVLGAVWRFKAIVNRQLLILILVALTYIVICAIFIAFSTPNIGTLHRYKTGYMIILYVLTTFAVFRIGRSQ